MTPRIRSRLVALGGASLLLLASAAWAGGPSLLIMPVGGAEAGSPAAFELHGALMDAFGAEDRFEVAAGAPLVGERSADRYRQSAEEASANALVAARLESGKVTVELRSAHSGGVMTTWSLDASDLSLSSAVREAELVLAAQSSGGTRARADGASDAEDESVFAGLRTDGPIAIRSDQLDVATKDGQRHLIFRRNVVVEQADIELHSDKLDAFYAEGDSQPERLIAHGDVEVSEGDRVAYCDVATYSRSNQKIICKGHARLVQGCDVVRGEQLEFDLEREHFRVVGAASVVIAEGDDRCSSKTNDVEAGS